MNNYKIVIPIFIALMMAVSPTAFSAEISPSESLTLIVQQQPLDPTYPDNDDVGKRSMARPIQCIIDFSENSVTISIESEIIGYEIWDEDTQICILTVDNDFEFVKHLSTLTGSYQLRLVTDTYTYIGYINL